MNIRVLNRYGSRYILVMMIVTRLVACVTGSLCVVYVNLTFQLSVDAQWHFALAAAAVILAAVVVTILMALWETRDLRHVLGASAAASRSITRGRNAPAARPCSSPDGTPCMKRLSIPW